MMVVSVNFFNAYYIIPIYTFSFYYGPNQLLGQLPNLRYNKEKENTVFYYRYFTQRLQYSI